MTRTLARVAAWIAAAGWILTGAWASFAPRSFYDTLATFPPYNVHLLHDIGAFSFGLGAVLVLVLGVRTWSGARAGIAGVAVGATAHFVSHVVDYDLKPSPADLVFFGVTAAMTWFAAFAIE